MKTPTAPVAAVLDLARWAPSGDNTQPWRFEIVADDHVAVHGFDTRHECVYDLDGRPSQISIGALLETIRIAATGQRLRADIARRTDSPEERPVFDVRFTPDASAASDLIPVIRTRTVQRRALDRRALRPDEKARLESSLPPGYTVVWIEGARKRAVARLLFRSAKIRLTMPEAFEVHRRVIAWDAQFSEDRMPDAAVGLDPVTTRLMRWTMQSWGRVRFMNTFMAGTVLPRVQLDVVPALACGAHVLIVGPRPPVSIDDYVDAGGAVQRFWLTAAVLGLQHQPELTPLIFARYVRDGRRFSAHEPAMNAAPRVAAELGALVGEAVLPRVVWMGRLGAGEAAQARSLRLPLQALLLPS